MTLSTAWGPLIAAENDAIERELEAARAVQSAKSAAAIYAPGVPSRFRDAVYEARQRVATAQQDVDQAERTARSRIQAERPSEPLARLWLEEAMLAPGRALETAQAALAAAELACGEQVQARQQLAALEARAPGERVQAELQFKHTLAQIEQQLQAARLRCATS